MTDEEKIEAVTAALTGDPYFVGRRIRHKASTRSGWIRHITRAGEGLPGAFITMVYVTWDNGDTACMYPGEVELL